MVRALYLLLASSFALSPPLQAGASGSRVHYVGGTVAELPSKSEGTIETTDEEIFMFEAHGVRVRVPYKDINVLEYGQRVTRRIAEAILISPLMLLSKRRAHFLTVGYADAQGRQQAMVFQVGSKDVRAILVGLEARTGRRVEFQDEEARKGGKG